MNPNRPQMGRARGRAKAPPAAGQAPRPGQAPETMVRFFNYLKCTINNFEMFQ